MPLPLQETAQILGKTADRLAELHAKSFGGKPSGRYRIPYKIVRDMMGRRRLYSDDIQMLNRALLERGFVLIDMDTFFVVLSINSFVHYRRANLESVSE